MVCSYHGKEGLNPIEAGLQVDELPLDKLLHSTRCHTLAASRLHTAAHRLPTNSKQNQIQIEQQLMITQ